MKKAIFVISLAIRFAVMVGVIGIVYTILSILMPFQKKMPIKICMWLAASMITSLVQRKLDEQVVKECNDWLEMIDYIHTVVYKKGETYAYNER